jgi:hypothetical protein
MRATGVISAVAGFLLIFSAVSYSQKNYVGLSFGSSKPGREYALKSLDRDGGYALTGFVVDFPGAYLFNHTLGIAGLSILLSPPWELTVIAGQDEYFESLSGQRLNFACMLGTGVRFSVNSSYAIRLSADCFLRKASFKVDNSGAAGGITGKPDFDMSVGMVNLSTGLAYRF